MEQAASLKRNYSLNWGDALRSIGGARSMPSGGGAGAMPQPRNLLYTRTDPGN